MLLKYSHKTRNLQVDDHIFSASCHVRNEINKRRLVNQVVYTIPDKTPYYPRQFPIGTWEIYEATSTKNPEMAPYIIRTNAFLMVDAWEVKNGKYYKNLGIKVKDAGYHIHLLAMFRTTQGCIGVQNLEDIVMIYKMVREAFERKEKIILEVTA